MGGVGILVLVRAHSEGRRGRRSPPRRWIALSSASNEPAVGRGEMTSIADVDLRADLPLQITIAAEYFCDPVWIVGQDVMEVCDGSALGLSEQLVGDLRKAPTPARSTTSSPPPSPPRTSPPSASPFPAPSICDGWRSSPAVCSPARWSPCSGVCSAAGSGRRAPQRQGLVRPRVHGRERHRSSGSIICRLDN